MSNVLYRSSLHDIDVVAEKENPTDSKLTCSLMYHHIVYVAIVEYNVNQMLIIFVINV